jgi:hypothetical protein
LTREEETHLRNFQPQVGIEEAPVFMEKRHEHRIGPGSQGESASFSVCSPERNKKTQPSSVSGYCFNSATGAYDHCVGDDVGLPLVAFGGETKQSLNFFADHLGPYEDTKCQASEQVCLKIQLSNLSRTIKYNSIENQK